MSILDCVRLVKVNEMVFNFVHVFDSPWSNGRSTDGGWPDSTNDASAPDNKDGPWPNSAQPSLTDLVPEFEPGKPWKVNDTYRL